MCKCAPQTQNTNKTTKQNSILKFEGSNSWTSKTTKIK
jgi:hypothetical protein